MRVEIRRDAREAVIEAASLLSRWLADPEVSKIMVAGGNTPLPLYRAVAERRPDTSRLSVFVLDEYVGVPQTDPRICTELLRRNVAFAWGVPSERFFGLRSDEASAEAAVVAHERAIEQQGGLDAIVLGLGRNGHLGFNEPGSDAHTGARVLDLDPVSIRANAEWFAGEHAPSQGATVGLRTILSARRVLLLAFGANKADAVRSMTQGPITSACPASFLQTHAQAHVYLDEAAATLIS